MTNPHCRIGRVRPRDKRVALFPGVRAIDAPLHRQPNTELVDNLRRMLARAERGEVTAMAAAWVYADGATGSGWSGAGRHRSALTSGAIAFLLVDYLTESIRASYQAAGPSAS